MPYSIRTKDGIVINNIPDDIKPDSQELKDRVAQLRTGRQSTEQRAPTPEEVTDRQVVSGEIPVAPERMRAARERLGLEPAAPAPTRTPEERAARRTSQRRESAYNTIAVPVKQGLAGLMGVAEMAGAMGSGMFGQAIGGLNAIGDFTLGNTARAAQTVENTSRWWTYMPRSQTGQEIATGLARPVEKLDSLIKDGANFLGGGNPELATIAYTALNSLPVESQLGRITTAVKSARASRLQLAAVENTLLEKGIQLGSYKMSQQIGQAAQNAVPGTPSVRGEAIADLAGDVRQEAFWLSQAEDMMYSLAKETPAYITSRNLQGLQFAVNDLLKGFMPDVRESGRIKYIQNRLDELIGDPKAIVMNADRGLTSLVELDQLRRQLKSSLPEPGQFSGIDKATLQIKGQLDDFIDRKFEEGLIHGDAEALDFWKTARGITAQYRRDFGPDSVLYRLATDHNANPEDFRKYIFGLSHTGVKTEATQVVQALKRVFGENSPQVNALRVEFLVDVMKPLRDHPDLEGLQKFVSYYQKINEDNPMLIKELSPFAANGLDEMYRVAKAAVAVGDPSKFTFSIPTMLARVTVGHQIARKGALVKASGGLLEAIFGKSPRNVRRQMISELVGTNVDEPMFKPGSVELQAVWAAALNEAFTREFEDQQKE